MTATEKVTITRRRHYTGWRGALIDQLADITVWAMTAAFIMWFLPTADEVFGVELAPGFRACFALVAILDVLAATLRPAKR